MKKLFFLLIIITSCSKQQGKDQNTVQEIPLEQQVIDMAIEKAGGEKFRKAIVDFDFREHHYQSDRNEGVYTYHRIKMDSLEETHDILDNEGFARKVDNIARPVADTMAAKYSRSINSVIYFALLPYGLNDPAVNKKYLGLTKIEGQQYHKIRVTFDQKDGGEDFQDVFVYWISKDSYAVDYLAYQYFTEGGGKRFRKAVNPRVIKGLRFVDYINYKPGDGEISIEKLDSAYQRGDLDTLSEIILRNVEVSYHSD